MNNPEIDASLEDPFKRHGRTFLRRKALVVTLLDEGKLEEALDATGHRYAKVIFDLFQQDSHVSLRTIADTIHRSRTLARTEVNTLRELGVPLGHKD